MAASKKDTPDHVQQAVGQALSASADLKAATRLAGGELRSVLQSPMFDTIRSFQEQLDAMGGPSYVRELRAAHEHFKPLLGAEHFKGIGAVIDGAKLFNPDLLSGSIFSKIIQGSPLSADSAGYLGGFRSSMSSEALGLTLGKNALVGVAVREAFGRSAGLLASLKLQDYSEELRHLSGLAIETGKMFGSLDLKHGLADLLGVHDATRSLVEYETGRLNRAYAGFASNLASRPEWFATAPEFLTTSPADVVFSQARFVRTVTTHEIIEEPSDAGAIWTNVQDVTLAYIEAVLPEVSPKLMRAWDGVWDAARRRGPDWPRQAAASLRFVLVETLDSVAPKGELTDVPSQYLNDGKPGRQAQIHWLCAPLKNRTYGRVARADLESAISIIDAMSEAVHRDDYVEIEDAFDTLAIRAAVALSNLLKLWKVRQ